MKSKFVRITLATCLTLPLFACESRADKGTGSVDVRKEPARESSANLKPEAAPALSPSAALSPPAAPAPAKLELKAHDTSASATAAAQPEPAAARQGAVVSDTAFSTWLQGSSPMPSGPAQLEAVLVAKPPYHVNAEYPHKFTFSDPPPGLEYPEKTVRGMQITPERGALRLPVVAKSAGPSTVSGTLSFSVCTDERCLVEKRDLQVALDVK